MFMSEEQEIAIGKQNDPSIVAMYGLYENERLQKFINEKGQQMAKISHRPNLPFEFKILDSPVVNAFALPGGYVYFTRGILAHFNNEAEFAGVLGHEIGHVTARHGASQQSKATVAQILFIGGLVASPVFREFAQEGQQAMQLLFLKYGRDDESQSDELGVEYSTAIGYDSRHMANFFKLLDQMRKDAGGEALPTFLSTHPDPYNRYQTVNALSDKAQANIDKSTLKTGRTSYLQMLDGLIYGNDPRQGYVDNSMFYHPELKFQFPIPADWQTINTPSQVQMAPKDGNALMLLTLAQAETLEAASAAVLENYKLTLVEKKSLTLNGMKAMAMVADQVNEQTQEKIRVLTYLISYNGLIYNFFGVAKFEAFDNMIPYFNKTMRNFKQLTDQAKINKKPERISIKSAPRTTSLESLLKRDRMPEDRLKELALINGFSLDQQLTRGDLYKIIVTR
ncbi:MAG: M48 family metalloprotease [Saprospiraceae bacterium]|nr:M48 family metalloprotease [Saprospiraceae bacterium]